MTNQEVYDKVKAHLLTQNAKSISKKYALCKYRMIRSTKRCAIGCLIPDNLYEKEMEGNAVHNLLHDFPKVKEFFDGVSSDLLDALQTVHDNELVKNWPRELEVVAKAYGLTP